MLFGAELSFWTWSSHVYRKIDLLNIKMGGGERVLKEWFDLKLHTHKMPQILGRVSLMFKGVVGFWCDHWEHREFCYLLNSSFKIFLEGEAENVNIESSHSQLYYFSHSDKMELRVTQKGQENDRFITFPNPWRKRVTLTRSIPPRSSNSLIKTKLF